MAGARLRATGMSVDQGVVRVEILGLGGGIGRTVVLAKGETRHYKGLEIVFDDFDLSDFAPEAGKINLGAKTAGAHLAVCNWHGVFGRRMGESAGGRKGIRQFR